MQDKQKDIQPESDKADYDKEHQAKTRFKELTKRVKKITGIKKKELIDNSNNMQVSVSCPNLSNIKFAEMAFFEDGYIRHLIINDIKTPLIKKNYDIIAEWGDLKRKLKTKL